MRILVVASTENEISPFISFIKDKRNIDYIITGIGMVETVYNLTKRLNNTKYDFVLNAGIAGSFSQNNKLGEVVNVTNDMFSEIGTEDGDSFIPLDKMGLYENENPIFNQGQIVNKTTFNNKTLNKLKTVKGITVNTIHGNENSIKKTINTFNPDIETMEGAAFMFVCAKENLPYAQIRSISNYVEKRNKDKWNIPLAIKNLNKTIIDIINEKSY